MKNAKVVLIVAVVVVCIVIASAGFFFLKGSGEGAYRSDDTSGRLMIYGNANNDDYLDDEDISLLEKIIDGDAEATDYADANVDGTVDQKDIDMVQKMIDREPMEINYEYYHEGETVRSTVSYPITSACVVGTNCLVTVKALGALNNVICISGGVLDEVLYSDMLDLPKVSDSAFEASTVEVSKYAVDTIITQDSDSYLKNYADFEAAGIDVVRISASDGLESIGGVITLGYLMQCEERANNYAKFCDDVLDHISSKVGPDALSDSERVTALSVTMSNYVGGTSSDYYAATQLVGAKNLADWPETTKRFNLGDEWLLDEKYQAQYIIHSRSIGYENLTSEDIQTIWSTYSQYFTAMHAYQDGKYLILNGNMPVVIRMAYMASIFYPEIMGADYGDQIHQQYIDLFVDNLHESHYDVTTDGVFVITKDMVSP